VARSYLGPHLPMQSFAPPLPIDPVLPDLLAALREQSSAVLIAPPGAGKTTRVPLVLAAEPWAAEKKILLLEPRRLAARAAAARMAASLREKVGDTVGLRLRFGSKLSRSTRIEVVTEGVFTRLILEDPSLQGVAAVLFDEFHERSLDADLGLALAIEVQRELRQDLKLLVMSATLDAGRIAELLGGARMIASAGRAFPVATRYLGRDVRAAVEPQMAEAIVSALRAEQGSVLAFLPGAAEIRRTETLLAERVRDPAVSIVALYGALDADAQDRAIAPAPPGRRKIVLATSIAETSLTIEGVRIVVDSGLARVPRYEPDVGLTRLVTVRVSRASAEQRRGRAGRNEPGVCLRLWDKPQTASLEPHNKPEILVTDLSAFVLDLAFWGSDADRLALLDPPPKPALDRARALLRELGALDGDNRITEWGRRLRRLPLPLRLAHMLALAADRGAGRLGAEIAMVLSERGLGGDAVDLSHRLEAFRRERSRRAADAREMARRWATVAGPAPRHSGRPPAPPAHADPSPGAILAIAYPDRIAKSRAPGGGAFLIANGRGAQVDPALALAREPFLAVGELAGSATQSRILLAAPISLAEIEAVCGDRVEARDEVTFDPASAALRGRRIRRVGALAISDQPIPVEPDADAVRTLVEGIARLGIATLPWTAALQQLRDRVAFLRRLEGDPWPDLSDDALSSRAFDWLAPVLAGKTAVSQLSERELTDALLGCVPWALRRRLEAEAPTHLSAPSGSRLPIDYAAEGGPRILVRVQELFGLDRHPAIAGGRVPLVLELLSPAHHPVQVTRDLPSFWRGSYRAVKAEMKGRYPKHAWPDDPIAAQPSRRAKSPGPR
jgi:ATP-dependent helicase HrpB